MNPTEVLTAAFGGTVVARRVPRPGYPWYLCPECGEVQQRKAAKKVGCIMTPGCKGVMEVYLIVRCGSCGAPLSGRSRDGRFCKKACREGTT